MNYKYFDRDLSWLSFNERVLLEASKDSVPLRERINFLSIFSSNLDEFYRVRMPALMTFSKIKREKKQAIAALEQKYRKPDSTEIEFTHLLVAQFNLQQRF